MGAIIGPEGTGAFNSTVYANQYGRQDQPAWLG